MATNWTEQKERGSTFGVSLGAFLYRLFGRRLSLLFLSPGVFYFYLTGREQRLASRDYLNRVYNLGYIQKRPGFWTGFSHFMNFAGAMVDRLGSWLGKYKASDVDGADSERFSAAKAAGGALVITAHLGNPDLLRAVATMNKRFRVNVLMHTDNAEQINNVINSLSQESSVRLIHVKDIDVSVAMQLSEAIQAGEWVVMAADRGPAHGGGDMLEVEFMGEKTAFPTGPYVLAAALKCPVHFVACIREGKGFKLVFEEMWDKVTLPRRDRLGAAKPYVQAFANQVESVVKRAPLQWYNFYDFWRRSDAESGDEVKVEETAN